MKLTLTYVDRKERVSAKTNKPFVSISIKAQEYNDKFLSGFGNKDNAGWKVGDVVEVAGVTEVSKDGKIYLNFEMPKSGGNAEVSAKLDEILSKLTRHGLLLEELVAHKRMMTGENKAKVAGTDIDYPEMDETNNGVYEGLDDPSNQ